MVEGNILIAKIILSLGLIGTVIALYKFRNAATKTVMLIIISIFLMHIGGFVLAIDRGKCSFLGKPLMVQDLATGKDFVVSQVLGERYTIIEVKKEIGSWGIVMGLPPMPPETIFIVAERNGKKIVVPVEEGAK